MLFIILINSMFSADALDNELCCGCAASVCLESRLTEVLPVEGCLTQELCETGDIPEAQVDSLTRQRMHTVSCVPAQTQQNPAFSLNTINSQYASYFGSRGQ